MGRRVGFTAGRSKGETKNKHQLTKKRERAAAAEAADRAVAAEAMADLASPAGGQQVMHDSPETAVENKVVQQERRRAAIINAYHGLGCPPEEQWWRRGGTVAIIARDWLHMKPNADVRPIYETLRRYVAGEELTCYSNSGGKQKLTKGESAVAADCLRCGRGYEQTAYILTARRKQKGMSEEEAKVGAWAVRTAFHNLVTDIVWGVEGRIRVVWVGCSRARACVRVSGAYWAVTLQWSQNMGNSPTVPFRQY